MLWSSFISLNERGVLEVQLVLLPFDSVKTRLSLRNSYITIRVMYGAR